MKQSNYQKTKEIKQTKQIQTNQKCGKNVTSHLQTPKETQKNISLSDILGNVISRSEALEIIKSNPTSLRTYQRFPEDFKEEILNFVMGKRGLNITYDSFFHKIFHPHEQKERLESFLSAILGQTITIKEVLEREGNRLADEGSLVIMDILVILEDGTYMNVEIQKIGYAFPGQRACCYSADMIMRQYNKIRSIKKEKFSYSDMTPVKLIILMEDSSKEFLEVAPHYMHKRFSGFDSGAKVADLSDITYISLDTFHKVVKNIDTSLHAWLTFLSSDKPEEILRLIKAFPEFIELYKEIAEFRRKPEELITMYSEALAIMDRNTVKYMCEEQKKELKRITEEKEQVLAEKEKIMAENEKVLAENEKVLAENEKVLAENEKVLAENEKVLAENEKITAERDKITDDYNALKEEFEKMKRQLK